MLSINTLNMQDAVVEKLAPDDRDELGKWPKYFEKSSGEVEYDTVTL